MGIEAEPGLLRRSHIMRMTPCHGRVTFDELPVFYHGCAIKEDKARPQGID